MSPTSISQLKLTNFRNYQSKSFDFYSKIIAISGDNGIGKTNILEAISLLSKGQGLKNAEFNAMTCYHQNIDNFVIYSDLINHPHIDNIGISYSKVDNKKNFQINRQLLNNYSKNKIFPTIIWLAPQMDNLFCSSKTLRRKFLDKITSDINIHHNSRINLYNHSLRERMNLLNNFSHQKNNWLDIVERKIAELGIAIATTRNETIDYLNQTILQANDNFTKATIKIIGEIEELAKIHKAIEIEENFIHKLHQNRTIDSKSGRTNFGIHRSDFTAILQNKNIEAKFCSTGEQKSILIALTFARVKILSLLGLPSAILLLDEIFSHLDDKKRINLLNEISQLNCQSFLTATNKEFFAPLNHLEHKTTQFLELGNL